jgi:molecular chaperone GrpE
VEDQLMRALAEADNLRKQRARDIEAARAAARADTVQQLLPVLDNLDRALEHADADPRSIVDGVRAVREQATRLLADLGFARRDDTGQVFDPARHDAVGSRPADGLASGTVAEVVRPAYGDGEHQLRPAQVVVAKDS